MMFKCLYGDTQRQMTVTQHEVKQEWYKRGEEKMRKEEMVRERKSNGEQSELRLYPAAVSSSKSQSGNAQQYSSSSSSWHQIAAKHWALHTPFTWLGPLFRGSNPVGTIALHLLSSASSKLPSLNPVLTCQSMSVTAPARKEGKTFFFKTCVFTPQTMRVYLLKVTKQCLIFAHNEIWTKRWKIELFLPIWLIKKKT